MASVLEIMTISPVEGGRDWLVTTTLTNVSEKFVTYAGTPPRSTEARLLPPPRRRRPEMTTRVPYCPWFGFGLTEVMVPSCR